MKLGKITAAVEETGLSLRGTFHPEGHDAVPAMDDGRPAGTLLLLGTVGPLHWPRFSASMEYQDGTADALDRWSRRTIDALAQRLNAQAHYPFGGPPHLPFVAWAKRAEDVAESPLGILIHPEHGLWHAYRGALALKEHVPLPPRQNRPRPCETCVAQPCLSACPVAAFGSTGYDVGSCSTFLTGPEGGRCMSGGCQARKACPVGEQAQYLPAQIRFHMAAFKAARQRTRP